MRLYVLVDAFHIPTTNPIPFHAIWMHGQPASRTYICSAAHSTVLFGCMCNVMELVRICAPKQFFVPVVLSFDAQWRHSHSNHTVRILISPFASNVFPMNLLDYSCEFRQFEQWFFAMKCILIVPWLIRNVHVPSNKTHTWLQKYQMRATNVIYIWLCQTFDKSNTTWKRKPNLEKEEAERI